MTRALGAKGESIAEEYLIELKYKILDKNYRCKFGEIDLVVYKNGVYVFVEVKTRKTLAYGRPVEAINYEKKKHLLYSAQSYIQSHNLKDCNYQFDAIEVIILSKDSVEVNHIPNII